MSLVVDIKKSLGIFKLDIQFSANNEILGLLGASGCGKSMTLRCIAGIEKPDVGKIILNGRVLYDSENNIDLPPQKRKVGYLFQNYALFPNMTVEENIASGVNDSKKYKAEIVASNIEMFLLHGLEKKLPRQLSGGQQQRVALARILASKPNIIMLDEPFCALDSYLKWHLEQELMELLKNFHGTVILVSHNRNEIYRFSNTVAVVSNGRIEAMTEKKELFKAPKTVSAALLTGCKNISRAKKLSEHSLLALDWELELYSGMPVPDNINYVGMRAHHLAAVEYVDQNNVMNCQIINVIENPFSYIVMLINLDSKENAHIKIRWEVDKNKWDTVCKTNSVKLLFDKDNLLLLS